jgi:hypothetical protein
MTIRLTSRALQLSKRGWYVFPLRPFDKRPLPGFTKWETRATTDRAQIIRWWSVAPYNIGIATGPSGLLVIDLDTSKDKGNSDWRVLGADVEIARKQVPKTFSVRTPSGGLHLYFTAPDQRLGTTAGKLGRHVDTRGSGGYVVGPRSVCSGRYYVVVDHAPIAPLPKWITKLLEPKPHSRPPVPQVRLRVSTSGLFCRGRLNAADQQDPGLATMHSIQLRSSWGSSLGVERLRNTRHGRCCVLQVDCMSALKVLQRTSSS